MSEEQIDIVIPWVDGNDPQYKAKLNRYRNATSEHEDVGGQSRYDDLGELYYCLKSIFLFAPFIRKVFIVTDGQTPRLEGELTELSSQKQTAIEIIDHKTIFRGYEEYLPVFNSRAIETVIWRIPDLSERFILMNDDFFFVNPVTAEDFFKGENTFCYANYRSTLLQKAARAFRRKKNGHRRIEFKDSMLRAVELTEGGPLFLNLKHTPRPLRKSFYENFYASSDKLLKANIENKFRDGNQFNSQELFYIHEYRRGRLIVVPAQEKLLYLIPKKKKNYIDRKLREFDANPHALFCCVNTLCLAGKADQEKALAWIDKKLSL